MLTTDLFCQVFGMNLTIRCGISNHFLVALNVMPNLSLADPAEPWLLYNTDPQVELSNRGIRQTTELFSRRDDSFSERTGFLQHKKTEFQSRRVSYNTTQINTRTDEARITRRLQIHIRCFCNTSTSQGSFLIAKVYFLQPRYFS